MTDQEIEKQKDISALQQELLKADILRAKHEQKMLQVELRGSQLGSRVMDIGLFLLGVSLMLLLVALVS
ncbi:MAG: hypothetical protein AAGH17_04110 [Pseudomonadota bacterium]